MKRNEVKNLLKGYLLANPAELFIVLYETKQYTQELDYWEVFDMDELDWRLDVLSASEILSLDTAGFSYDDEYFQFDRDSITSFTRKEYQILLIDNIDNIIDEFMDVYEDCEVSNDIWNIVSLY